MYIFTNENDVIFHISETLDYQSNGNYLVDNGKLAIPTILVKGMFEVEEIPSEVEIAKYCYTEEKGFYKNENYRKYYSLEERVALAEGAINTLLGF